MIQFRVVTITDDLAKYPQYHEDTEEFSDLVVFLTDPIESFVVDPRDGNFWPIEEFFNDTDISHFVIDSSEAPAVPEELEELEKLICTYGEEYRRLITDALEWLEDTEESWDLDKPMDKDTFINGLVEKAICSKTS